jgi:diguanylate cyclase (GGDEF)-like protein
VKLKNRLLVNFVAVVLMALLVFGYNAYEMAGDSVDDAVQTTLANAGQLSVALLASGKPQSIAATAGAALSASKIGGTHTMAIIDGDGRLMAPALSSKSQAGQDWPLTEILARKQATGSLTRGGRHYVWSITPLPHTNDRLLLVVRPDNTVRGGLARLASRLSVMGLIVVWVAVWVALIMATMVSRRLDAQTFALQHQATHDSLTGLPNRALLNHRLAQAIRAADASGRSVSLVMMDLDHFKEINDTLGHHVGDGLLQALGERLQKVLWGSDTVARLGGDEFALLLPLADSSHTAQVIGKVLQALAEPFAIKGLNLDVDASLGIAVYPEDAKNAVELISHADVAMYQAKQRGERHMRYDAGQDPHSLARLTLMGDLRHATDRNEISLHYQPKVDVRTQKVVGVEALLRWRHPQHGMVPPDSFIAQAEQTGIIKPLTYWILNEAVRQCAEWNAAGISLSVSVNLSVRVVQDVQLPGQVASLLERHEVRAEQLELEITETAIMNDPLRATQVLSELDTMGVRLSIDDFGTGYTSLAQLKRLPVDEVKIDRSFVLNMLRDANDTMIVRSIIDLAHNMNRIVVAEGVESKKILDALADLQCDVAQGYFYSRPLPAAEFHSWYEGMFQPERASGPTPLPGSELSI